MIQSFLSFLKSPWGVLSLIANALGIGNFQNDYYPQLVKWSSFFLDIFEVLERVGSVILAPVEFAIRFLFRIPDWNIPAAISSYVVLNAILLGPISRLAATGFLKLRKEKVSEPGQSCATKFFAIVGLLWVIAPGSAILFLGLFMTFITVLHGRPMARCFTAAAAVASCTAYRRRRCYG